MKGKQNDEDSESDWDSISELHPPKSKASIEEPSENEAEERPENTLQYEKPPPFSFRSEVETSPSQRNPPLRPPGKKKKGKLYDPSFSPQGEMVSPYKTAFPQENTHTEGVDDYEREEDALPTPPRVAPSPKRLKKLPKIIRKKSEARNHSSGVGNQGYQEDESEGGATTYPEWNRPEEDLSKNSKKKKKSHFKSSLTPPDDVPFATDPKRSPKSRDEMATPTAFLSPFTGPLKSVDSLLQKAFNYAALPFSCFFLLVHHLIKFVLLVIVKSLFLDVLSLISVYLLEPLLKGFVRPLFQSIREATESFSGILVSILSPAVQVVRACRLVEVNLHTGVGCEVHKV